MVYGLLKKLQVVFEDIAPETFVCTKIDLIIKLTFS
jgi:hypothetical protein